VRAVVGYNWDMPWTVYVARCCDGSLYTGITTDPARRLAEHNAGGGAAYTRSRTPLVLVYSERARSRSMALRREHAIKRLTRAQKEALVNAGENGITKTRRTARSGRSGGRDPDRP
jgi:putative endonuclease